MTAALGKGMASEALLEGAFAGMNERFEFGGRDDTGASSLAEGKSAQTG